MSDVNHLLDELFGGRKSFTHKENLIHSQEEEGLVREWLASAEGRLAMDEIPRAYQLRKAGLNDRPELHLLDSPYANAFAITYDPFITEKTFSRLFFAFGLRMLDLGYYRVSFDRTIQEVSGLVKTSEKQYFKPNVPTDTAGKLDQLYGNVCIEKDLINNKPSFLKVLVTVHSGRNYYDARPFDQFMEDLFNI